MRIRMLAPRAELTLSDGSTVEVERIGKGRYTTAWRNCSNVYLQTNEKDYGKEIVCRASQEGEGHMTATEKVDRHHWHGGKSYNDDDCSICDEVMRRDNNAMLLRTVTTEKVKHTSGPWFTDIRTVNTSDHHVVTVECSDGMGRARLADCGPIGAIGSICDLENGANARLIAASPDLAAFAQAVSFAPYLLTPDQWATEARQVLEKAGLL